MKSRFALAGVAVALLAPLLFVATPAGASPPPPVLQTNNCENGNPANCSSNNLPTVPERDAATPWYDLSEEIAWARSIQPGNPNVNAGNTPDLQELVDDFGLACDLAVAGFQASTDSLPGLLEAIVAPIVGVVSYAVAFACNVADPFLSAIAWIAQPVVNLVWPLYAFLSQWISWVVQSAVSWALVSFFQTLQLLFDGVASIGSAIGTVWSGVGQFIIDDEQLDQTGEYLLAIALNSQSFGSNLGELASSISIDSDPGAYCFTVAGMSGLCPLALFQGESPPFQSFLIAAWVGYWAVFVLVQSLAWFSRATDS